MRNLDELYEALKAPIPEDTLFRILFEMNKYFDKEFTESVQRCQRTSGKVFNAIQRRSLRRYFYYKTNESLKEIGVQSFDSIDFADKEKTDVLSQTLNRIEVYDSAKIINSIIKRFENIKSGAEVTDNASRWLAYYDDKRKQHFKYSLIVLLINQSIFKQNGYDSFFLYKQIAKIYSSLENYRHIAIVFDGDLRDSKNNVLTWDVLYKVSIFCENFMQFNEKFYPFSKAKQIEELADFIHNRTSFKQSLDLARQFYSSISYGFKYEDCLVSSDCSTKILIFKKIELDNRSVPCPSCMTTIQSGNSYPELFLRSWECKNPSCPDRSKSGRGKRFDEFGTYRYFKLVEDDPNNRIDSKIYKTWKRDVFPSDADVYEMLLRYYAWNKEVVGINFDNSNINNRLGRIVNQISFDDLRLPTNCVDSFSKLPIVVLFKGINKRLNLKTGVKTFSKQIVTINDNSTNFLQTISNNLVGSAITSPPYYNAREYSQWPTLILYLIDMMANAKAVFNVLDSDGTYLYNIGDIVSEDNIYVRSNMSKKRLQLGFLSCMIFEIAGFKLDGNIIWDKGEVQSKRNSTINLNSGYVKCINCYEHVFVFKKKPSTIVEDKVARFGPVIKINCKGENIYKHTAPYPAEMVELIRPYVINNKYILDPFLGSGTTLVWCKDNNYKGLGVELNKDYYELCLDNLSNVKLV